MAAAAASLPFDAVIISFPDRESARHAPLDVIRKKFPHCRIVATTDPYGCRVGSGGGTLQALTTVVREESPNDNNQTLLVIHAGGDSSRCPTEMVTGKAWTSLPSRNGITTPLQLWLEIYIPRLLGNNVPAGSVVVLASDTLLSLPAHIDTVEWERMDADSVVGLAVPAPYHVATNHGVYHLVQENAVNNVQPCHQLWQKPSIHLLESYVGRESTAWIDTGVILYLPHAADRLRKLSRLPSAVATRCTADGIQWLQQQQQQQQQHEETASSLVALAQSKTVQVDLYTHLLQPLRLASGPRLTKEDYIQTHKNLPTDVATELFNTWSNTALHVWKIPQGQFLHLGTTREYVDFLLSRSFQVLGQEQFWVPRCQSFTDSRIDPSVVVMQSILQTNQIGKNSVVEYSQLSANSVIPEGCLVCGFRGDTLRVPVKELVVQQVKLKHSPDRFVFIVLGVHDNIKGNSTIYNRNLGDVLQHTSLTREDIWPTKANNELLWNAKIHPIVTTENFESLYAWLATFNPEHDSWTRWKESPKLSLADIRDQADAIAEFSFRQDLATKVNEAVSAKFEELRNILLQRRHESTDLSFVSDRYRYERNVTITEQAIQTLHRVILEAYPQQRFDICGRTFMVLSELLAEISEGGLSELAENEGEFVKTKLQWQEALVEMRSRTPTELGSLAMESFGRLFNDCELIIKQGNRHIQYLSDIMESFSQIMVQYCVCQSEGRVSKLVSYLKTEPIMDKWVSATAPARIDLAGGWSDTPPICFEYGAAVTGIAVLVNGVKPLSAKCRIVTGGSGIILRARLRQLSSNELFSIVETKLRSVHCLEDYKDPTSDFALVKCALICLGLIRPIHFIGDNDDLQPHINSFCQSENNVGMEICIASTLPRGSGLGTSSILGGCVLAAIASCVGIDTQGHLVDLVLDLEQQLTTGGGFQDQVNGLIGGAKIVICQPYTFPIDILIQPIPLQAEFKDQLSKSLTLLFTGKTRLAKNILQNVLRRWSRRSLEIVATVRDLLSCAHDAEKALVEGSIEKLGCALSEYWELKKKMAGPGSGAEPPCIQKLMCMLREKGLTVGGTLCGAGGGGFMALLSAPGTSREIQELLASEAELHADFRNFEWYECQLSDEGLTVLVDP